MQACMQHFPAASAPDAVGHCGLQVESRSRLMPMPKVSCLASRMRSPTENSQEPLLTLSRVTATALAATVLSGNGNSHPLVFPPVSQLKPRPNRTTFFHSPANTASAIFFSQSKSRL
jgi:hypothetical protein